MISLELDMELPSKCKECPLRSILNGKWYCSASQVNMSDDCVNVKRPFWCKLHDNKAPSSMLHFKGELGDGHIHINAKDLIEHNVREQHEIQRMKLRKLANNPALSEDAKEVLNTQVYYINLLEWWREQYIKLQKKYEQLTIKDRKHLVKAKDWTNPKVKAVIKLDVPEWQIGQPVTVYFKDTMCKIGICEAEQE